MRPRSLRPALLAALAALLLTAGLAHTSEASDEASEGETITTLLHPGWNMVGWVGPETPTSEVFDVLSQLRRVSAWDAEAGSYRRAFRGKYSQLPSLTPGMGLWLHVGGNATVEWTRTVSGKNVLLSLRGGQNLVGWTGEDGIPIEEAVGRFGATLTRVSRWNAEKLLYEHHRPDRTHANPLAELRRGDAIWVDLTSDARWWQSGTAQTVIGFGEEVALERQAEIRGELVSVIAFFAEQYEIEPPKFWFNSYEDAPSITLTTFSGRPPARRVTSTVYVDSTYTGAALGETLAHEYFHVLQDHLARFLYPPAWMVEGSATYAGGLYVASTGAKTGDTIPGDWVRSSALVAQPLDELEEGAAFYGLSGAYELGALAVHQLVGQATQGSTNQARPMPLLPRLLEQQAGNDTYIEYYRLLASATTWQAAFEQAFGLTPEDFYEQFEVYRAAATFEAAFEAVFSISPEDFDGDLEPYRNAVGRPLAHSLDEVVEPVIVFVGDVPADTRLYVETEVANVHTLLTERLGFEPFEFSLYFAADDEAGRLTYFELYRSGVVGGHYTCALRSDRYSFHSMTCRFGFTYKSIIDIPFSQLLSYTYHEPHPYWLELAGSRYAEALYREEYGIGRLDDEALSERRMTAAYRAPLQQLDTPSGWREGDSGRNWSLAFLGAHWLAEHAGEQALAQYYRLLPRGKPEWDDYVPRAGSWQAAFEQAFGLTIEDFYEQFEAYRAGLAAQ